MWITNKWYQIKLSKGLIRKTLFCEQSSSHFHPVCLTLPLHFQTQSGSQRCFTSINQSGSASVTQSSHDCQILNLFLFVLLRIAVISVLDPYILPSWSPSTRPSDFCSIHIFRHRLSIIITQVLHWLFRYLLLLYFGLHQLLIYSIWEVS